MRERLTEIDGGVEVTLFGQEFNPETFIIAKSDMIIRGEDLENMRFGDTLSNDKLSGNTFNYIIYVIK